MQKPLKIKKLWLNKIAKAVQDNSEKMRNPSKKQWFIERRII